MVDRTAGPIVRSLLNSRTWLWLIICASAPQGCMSVNETHYLAVPGAEETNYFRIKVLASGI